MKKSIGSLIALFALLVTLGRGTHPAQAAPLPDLFDSRSVWDSRGDDATWKELCGSPIYAVQEGDPCI